MMSNTLNIPSLLLKSNSSDSYLICQSVPVKVFLFVFFFLKQLYLHSNLAIGEQMVKTTSFFFHLVW